MTINLTGPVSISYYYNKTLNKKIIILGDRHRSYKGECNTDTIKIKDYLASISNSGLTLDIFLETRMFEKKELQKGQLDYEYKIYDYLGEVLQYGVDQYKKNPKNRYHFTDIRGEDNVKDCDWSAYFKIDWYTALVENNLKQSYFSKKNLFGEFVYNLLIYITRDQLIDGSKCFSPALIKTIGKMKNKNNENANKILDLLLHHFH